MLDDGSDGSRGCGGTILLANFPFFRGWSFQATVKIRVTRFLFFVFLLLLP